MSTNKSKVNQCSKDHYFNEVFRVFSLLLKHFPLFESTAQSRKTHKFVSASLTSALFGSKYIVEISLESLYRNCTFSTPTYSISTLQQDCSYLGVERNNLLLLCENSLLLHYQVLKVT